MSTKNIRDVHLLLQTKLIDWLDRYARELSHEHNRKITRSMLIDYLVKKEYDRYYEIRRLNKEMMNDLVAIHLADNDISLADKYSIGFDKTKI